MILKKEALQVIERSGGLCELCGAIAQVFAHIEHRGMGGRHGEYESLINEHRNVGHLCVGCHDKIDNRVKCENRFELIEKLKQITDWPSWHIEFKGVIKRVFHGLYEGTSPQRVGEDTGSVQGTAGEGISADIPAGEARTA